MGIPLLIVMYDKYVDSLMVQYRGAKMLIMEQFPETAASIVLFKMDSDVVSLDGRDLLETDAKIGSDGKLHVAVRKSKASKRSLGHGSFFGLTHPSNLTGAEIYCLSSSQNPTLRALRNLVVSASYPMPNPEFSFTSAKTATSPDRIIF
ncbi:hypothetical protein RCOM_0816810 [Ricinus communis]|uniref:Uncharacterized protein n=1 Tax=Ricinus communis TaxID=3988 RepID=B9RX30_RICCO|nr:hypothetical protein RCOM_0816810 [Ricinus communis]